MHELYPDTVIGAHRYLEVIMGQIGLFDYENRLTELSEMGDPL